VGSAKVVLEPEGRADLRGGDFDDLAVRDADQAMTLTEDAGVTPAGLHIRLGQVASRIVPEDAGCATDKKPALSLPIVTLEGQSSAGANVKDFADVGQPFRRPQLFPPPWLFDSTAVRLVFPTRGGHSQACHYGLRVPARDRHAIGWRWFEAWRAGIRYVCTTSISLL
jgi:hypothetical protein